MNRLSRRNVLKSVFTLPAVSALQPLLAQGRSGASKIDTLNVFFHGPFSIVIYPKDCIEAITPSDADHKYQAGNYSTPESWLPLSRDTYSMVGVKEHRDQQGDPSGPHLDPTKSIVLDAGSTNINAIDPAKNRYCKIILPFPKDMRPLCLVAVKKEKRLFNGQAASFANQAQQIPLTQVLVYDIADAQGLRVLGLPSWRPLASRDGTTANLHFVVRPKDAHTGPLHAQNVFKNQVGLFKGLDLKQDGDIEGDCTLGNAPRGVDLDDAMLGSFRGSGDWPLNCGESGLIVVTR
jgi:hypothetical protein